MTTATHDKVDAYKTHQHNIDSDREIEARALLSCAHGLEAVRAPGCDRPAYTNALKRNQRLWTIFQVALCDPDNPLPRDLKITLLNLSRYVDKVSFRAIMAYKPDLLEGLININRHIAAGLTAKPAKSREQARAAEPPAVMGAVMTTA